MKSSREPLGGDLLIGPDGRPSLLAPRRLRGPSYAAARPTPRRPAASGRRRRPRVPDAAFAGMIVDELA